MKSINEVDLKEMSKGEFHPSPDSWQEQILYFLLVDRFSTGDEKELYNPETDYENALQNEDTKREWLELSDKWNGGTLKGLESKLDYLKEMGVTAIWVSPLLKQVDFEESYHGYGTQNFLKIDQHYGENEDFKRVVQKAHEKGIFVILDIILNHTGNVFTYEEENPTFTGEKYHIKAFNNSKGEPTIPVDAIDFDNMSINDGVWPKELMTPDTFSAKGGIVDWENREEYLDGDFFSLKNLQTGEGDLNNFKVSQQFRVIVECYKYWIAYADLDGFRIDTIKHINPGATRYFVQEIKEFAKSIGKNNFYLIGEITGGFEFAVDSLNNTGLDAALGINRVPEALKNVAKGYADPAEYFNIFKNVDLPEEDKYKWYMDNVITIFDDHDMVLQSGVKARFTSDRDTASLLANALFINLMTIGIPCIYYGTEQGFDGSGDQDKYVREAMFGGKYGAFRTCNKHFFNNQNPVYSDLAALCEIRKANKALVYGRQYIREVSYDNGDIFLIPHKEGEGRHTGIVAWSRVFNQEEFVLAMNCDMETPRDIVINIDDSLNIPGDVFECIFSNNQKSVSGKTEVEMIGDRHIIRIPVPERGHVIYKKIS